MTASDLLTDLRHQGFILTPLPEGGLEVKPASRLTDSLREAIRRRKSEILAALAGPRDQLVLWQPARRQDARTLPLPPPPSADALAAAQLFELIMDAWRRKAWGPCHRCGRTDWYQSAAGFSFCRHCVPPTGGET